MTTIEQVESRISHIYTFFNYDITRKFQTVISRSNLFDYEIENANDIANTIFHAVILNELSKIPCNKKEVNNLLKHI